MAYQIDRYNNTLLTVVEDGTVDQTTDLKFIGKNYAGYGEIQNENLLFLLENFSGANQPSRPLSGQVWFDSANSKLKFYDGTQWRTTGGSEISTEQPAGLAIGDFWWDSSNDQLYVYNGTSFILIGPQNAGEGITQMQSREVLDLAGATKGIIVATIEDEIIFTISTSNFTLNASTPLTGFDKIRKGITLKWTRESDNGVTNSDLTPDRDFNFWGTASSAKGLVVDGTFVDAGQFVTSGEVAFDDAVEFSDSGLLIGDSQDLQLIVDNGDVGVIQNVTGQNSNITIRATDGTGLLTDICTFNTQGIIPSEDNRFSIGTESLRWQNVHATRFAGEADEAVALKVGSNYRTASVSASPDTVAVRDATGNLAANLFQGTATQARYADLAEKYTTAEEYAVGTVLAVCEHEEHEMALATPASIVAGVISEKPAYLMNAESDGQAIALVGRVPVRVVGAVRKGDEVKIYANGVASVSGLGDRVGIALESNSDEGEKLVECILKV